MDEFERVAWLKRRFEQGGRGRVSPIGIGDDAAVLAPSSAHQVVSVDAAVEGVHFRWSFGCPRVLAARSVSAAASDLAAMGARPRALLCALSLADDIDDGRFKALIEGYALASQDYGLEVVGGNLTRGAVTSLTTTVIGEAERWATRGGARVGDRVYVTGPLGGAALGLQALLRAASGGHLDPHIERWRSPRARLDLSARVGQAAHAAIDISDGMLQDLAHLCQASGVAATVELDAVPLAPNLSEAADALGLDPLTLAISGGEDYELILCAPDDGDVQDWATPVGRLVDGEPGKIMLTQDGTPVPSPIEAGFRHFATPGDGT